MSYKNIYARLLWLLTVLLLTACSLQPADYPTPSEPKADSDRLIVLCEGLWGMDNSSLSLIDNGVLTNRWFQQQNPGRHLGDTGNDILQVNDTLIAISVNWSNIVQYIRPDGTAIAATENIPNNRRLATDHNGFLYVTSYADNGYVAKVDLRTKQVVDTCHVGREPEGIAYYDGRLYVANTGGYATQTKDHDYEQTVSVVDAQTMRELRRIDTGHKNLYGPFGTGGFFVRKGTKMNPFVAGGTGSDSLNLNMPKTIPAMLEPASPNIVAVAGMEAALDETIGRISDFEAKEKELTEYLVKGLEKIENVTTYLPLEDSHLGIVAFNIEGYKAEDVGTILDQDYHIAVRTGYHCAPLIHKHLMDIEKGGVVRASVGRYTTRDDIDRLLEAVEELSEEM